MICRFDQKDETLPPPDDEMINFVKTLVQSFLIPFSQTYRILSIHSNVYSLCAYTWCQKMNHKKEIDRHSLMVHGTHEKFMSYIEIKYAILKFLLKDAVRNLGVLS